MTISQVIELLESEMRDSGDVELMIYDCSGDLIEPKSFNYGGMSTEDGDWVDAVSFSDIE